MIAILMPDASDFPNLFSATNATLLTQKGILRIYRGNISNNPLLLIVSGYCKNNIAFALGYAFANYEITTVIGLGTCGTLNTLNACLNDVAISMCSFQYDVDFSQLGIPQTVIPNLEGGLYVSDPQLIYTIKNAVQDQRIRIVEGRFATADRFLNNERIASRLETEYEAMFVDSEAGNIGQICCLNEVPYVQISGITHAINSTAARSYYNNMQTANENVSNVVQIILPLLVV